MKRRLIGALVLVALAVIFLPELLENPKDYTPPIKFTSIPPPPLAETVAKPALLPASDAKPIVTPLPPAAETAQDQAPDGNDATDPDSNQPQPQTETVLSAWAVQVASFTNAKKAERLQSLLRKKGFTAFIESSESDGNKVQLVKVGPEAEKVQAEALAVDIKKKLQLDDAHVEPYQQKTLDSKPQ